MKITTILIQPTRLHSNQPNSHTFWFIHFCSVAFSSMSLDPWGFRLQECTQGFMLILHWFNLLYNNKSTTNLTNGVWVLLENPYQLNL